MCLTQSCIGLRRLIRLLRLLKLLRLMRVGRIMGRFSLSDGFEVRRIKYNSDKIYRFRAVQQDAPRVARPYPAVQLRWCRNPRITRRRSSTP